MGNIINATFCEGGGNVVYTKRVYQYSRGQKLRISGIALPEKYQVHFSNSEHDGVAAAIWASGSDVDIPNVYFETGNYIYIWISAADDLGKYQSPEYMAIIPVEKRPAILKVDSESGGLVVDAELDEEEHTLIFH